MRVEIVGFDKRQCFVGQAFERLGHTVTPVALPTGCADITVLPMPVSEDGAFLYQSDTSIADCFAVLTGKTVYGGRVSTAVKRVAEAHGVTIKDHFEREEAVVQNVIPTVEGALQLAMEQTPFTLHGAEVLVAGYGRIGKVLSESLSCLGALVTVSARKQGDFAWCKVRGYKTIHSHRILEQIGRFDLIFNTVPYRLFGAREIEKMREDALLIDLASAPGGTDFAAAEKLGKNVLHALALPPKVAPRTAGEIICNTILNMYQEEENTRDR